MKVYNLTDVPTPVLEARGLVDTPISVGGKSVQPGGDVTVASLNADEATFVQCGALAVGEPPASYRIAKAAFPKAVEIEQAPPPPPPPPPPEEPAAPERGYEPVIPAPDDESTSKKTKKKKSGRR